MSSLVNIRLEGPQPRISYTSCLHRACPGLCTRDVGRLCWVHSRDQFSRLDPCVFWHARLLLCRLHPRRSRVHLVWNAIIPGRAVPGSDDISHLAPVQQLSKPPPGKRPRHKLRVVVFLPVHHCSDAAALATCQQFAIYVHGKDGDNARIWADLVHMGACCRYVNPPAFLLFFISSLVKVAIEFIIKHH